MIGSIHRRVKAAFERISARSRIAAGMVFLLISVLWLAIACGIVPSERRAILAGRSTLCEAIAVHLSLFVSRNESEALVAELHTVTARNPDVISAAVRDASGKILADVGGHAAAWADSRTGDADETHVLVPIYAGESKWGTVEILFRPISRGGLLGYLRSPEVRLTVFVGTACMGLFLLYLRKTLRHLDPSKVVPPRVRSALDTLAEGLLVIDKDERIVLANQAFATIVGRPPEQMLGTRASQLAWLDDAAAPLTDRTAFPWAQAIQDGEPRRGMMMRLLDSTGDRRTFSVNCTPVLGDSGKYRGVLASFDDVTLLERKEVELRKSKNAAEEANRAKSEFLARMSHEIRTPMNAILGFADVLRRGYAETEAERQEHLDTIHSSGQHLLDLINDILDLSKIESGRLEIETDPCSPYALLSEVQSILSVRAEQKGIALRVEWDGPVPETIETDATRLRQAVTNLIGNAIKFTERGSVRVVPRVERRGDEARLVVNVIDTGIGMKPEALGRIFQPFAQADTSITRRFGGTGLGLSISRQIAEALGGSLTVTSEPGAGSTFTLEIGIGTLAGVRMLTAEAASKTLAAGKASVAQSLTLPPLKVLLVEDGVSNRKLIQLVLGRAGVTIDSAEDGKTGTELALRGSYDVILMDMQMPIMDGYTAARLLRSRGYAKPIIALTAHAMRGDEEKCRSAGCSGFLTKPIDMDLLVRTVGEAAGVVAEAAAAPPPAPHSQGKAGTKAHETGEAVIKSTLPTADPEFCAIVEEFIERLQSQLKAMNDAWQGQDLSQLASLAHWLKGSGGTAGFDALTSPARNLEQLSRDGRLEEIGSAIGELQRIASRIVPPSAIENGGSGGGRDENGHGLGV